MKGQIENGGGDSPDGNSGGPTDDATEQAPTLQGACDAEAALRRLGGLPDLYADVLHRFLNDSNGNMRRLHAAAEANDYTGLREAAHSVRGISAMCGADSVSDVAGRIETSVKACTTARLPQLVALLEEEFQVARIKLKDFAAVKPG